MAAVNSTSTSLDGESYATEIPPGSSTEYDYPDYGTVDYGRCVYEHHKANFLPALYAVFFILGLLGISLVIWVFARSERLRSLTDVFLLNLAIADLLLVCSLPFFAHQARAQWELGGVMCKIVLEITVNAPQQYFNLYYYCHCEY